MEGFMTSSEGIGPATQLSSVDDQFEGARLKKTVRKEKKARGKQTMK